MKVNAKPLIIIGIVLLLAWLYWQIEKAKQFTLKVTGFSLSKISLSTLKGSIIVSIFNPSWLTISVVRSDIDLITEGATLGTIQINQGVHFSSLGYTAVNCEFIINPKELKAVTKLFTLDTLEDPNKTLLQIKGSVTLQKFFIKFRVPLDIPITLADLISSDKNDKK